MTSNIKLQYVESMPKEIVPDTLYVSERFQVAVHQCACGCGEKVVTPLGPTEWSFTEEKGKPSLNPSIGNWQFPCRSHYWVTDGEIQWSYQWTDEEIIHGRKKEQERREAYLNQKTNASRKSLLKRFIEWLRLKL